MLDDAIREVQVGRMMFAAFPPMEVVNLDGTLYSLSNRRLFVSPVLANLGVISHVSVHLLAMDAKRVTRVKWDDGARAVLPYAFGHCQPRPLRGVFCKCFEATLYGSLTFYAWRRWS